MAMISTFEQERLHTEIKELIHTNGCHREEQRMEEDQVGTFGADLVLRGDNGFELWLGSLDDALNFESLGKLGIGAVLNCAVVDCEKECAPYRACRRGGRCRSHARGPSAYTVLDESEIPNSRNLDRDKVRALALFDSAWYSDMLGFNVSYMGFAANDESGYPMEDHFAEICDFLEQCRADGCKVLIHCVMGINRSATALVAFLCAKLAMSVKEAVDLVSKRRGHVLSNDSFVEQLITTYSTESAEGAETQHQGSDIILRPLDQRSDRNEKSAALDQPQPLDPCVRNLVCTLGPLLV